jgi:hypothetical protein
MWSQALDLKKVISYQLWTLASDLKQVIIGE